jgi:hypothetical protein
VQLAPRQLELFRAPRPLPSAPPHVPPPAEGHLELVSRAPRGETLNLARDLAQRIADHVGPAFRVLLTVHDNRSTMVSFRRQPPLVRLRLHHMFLEAPEAVVVALAEYAAMGKHAAGTVIDDFVASQQLRIRTALKKPTDLAPVGRCFDLSDIFERLNTAWFQGGIRARIGWGRNSAKRRRKSIRLGVYDHKTREIRVHPALDHPDVPLFFVEFIVYHEMLHQIFPSARDQGRHVHHPRAFRDRERAFPRYQAAIEWEREHLNVLLRR